MPDKNIARQKIIREIRLLLGHGMVEVELTPDHYELAIDLALDRYRQRSSNSVSERITFVDLQPEQTKYVMPKEVILVKQLYRRGTSGTASGTGVAFDPFGASFVNQSGIGLGQGAGSLLTYELYSQFQETIGRMFGLFINFTWDPVTHTFDIVRHIKSKETIIAQILVERSEEELLADLYARPWIRDYTSARCKIMLGEARGKFQSIVGPQGGTSLNADTLKQEGQAELDRLEQEVANQIEQDAGYGFILG
jgi:hypothetical protein